MPTFIDDDTHARLIAELAAIEREPMTGDRSAKVAEVLCMTGDVWPEGLRDEFSTGDQNPSCIPT